MEKVLASLKEPSGMDVLVAARETLLESSVGNLADNSEAGCDTSSSIVGHASSTSVTSSALREAQASLQGQRPHRGVVRSILRAAQVHVTHDNQLVAQSRLTAGLEIGPEYPSNLLAEGAAAHRELVEIDREFVRMMERHGPAKQRMYRWVEAVIDAQND